jgi:hypothetical protein
LQRAWSLIGERGPGSTYVLTGLEHSLPLAAEELEFADDEIAPALSFERLNDTALPAEDNCSGGSMPGRKFAIHMAPSKRSPFRGD